MEYSFMELIVWYTEKKSAFILLELHFKGKIQKGKIHAEFSYIVSRRYLTIDEKETSKKVTKRSLQPKSCF